MADRQAPAPSPPLWTCPACGRPFANVHQSHSCAPLGGVDEHFRAAAPQVRDTFDAVLQAVRSFGPVRVLAEKSRIAFQVRMSFAAFIPRRRWLNGHLVLARVVDSPRFLSVQTFSPRNVLHTFRLVTPDELDEEFVGWLGEAYAVGAQQHLDQRSGARVPIVGFSRAELESYRDAPVPDLVGPGLKLLFVGINPGLWTAATQTHFAHPGNRFYPALRAAGIVDRDLDRVAGMTDDDRGYLIGRGIGITNLVNRATIRADELSAAELRAGRIRLADFVAAHQPVVVAVAGVTAYRAAFGRPKARAGEQPETLGDARLWVVPNPSGLNAHETASSLAVAYAEPARAAGVI